MNAGCGVQEGGLRKSPSASSGCGSGFVFLMANMQACFPLEDYIPIFIWSKFYIRR
jgi:hypothetical protein